MKNLYTYCCSLIALSPDQSFFCIFGHFLWPLAFENRNFQFSSTLKQVFYLSNFIWASSVYCMSRIIQLLHKLINDFIAVEGKVTLKGMDLSRINLNALISTLKLLINFKNYQKISFLGKTLQYLSGFHPKKIIKIFSFSCNSTFPLFFLTCFF